jgi:CheY-like chemotaxis protein
MGAQPSILVVDDDAFSGEMAGAVLEDAGYPVILAEGAVDALEKLASEAGIGLVVSDLNMPFMDGLQLFSELRQQGIALPFILLTGEDPGALRARHPDLAAILAKDEHLPETLPAAAAAHLPLS